MPRNKTSVKQINQVVDLHFHGAFGIDVMHATPSELDELSRMLWKKGVSGYCPTTLSAPRRVLLESVGRIGRWIRSQQGTGHQPVARPLGIHLEGPFINPDQCGAHPRESIRPFNFQELEELWNESEQTLKILTIAPECLSAKSLSALCKWSKKHQVRLSMGHSQATEGEALNALKKGVSGVTHAWNALAFHHRAPGVLGAALGQKNVAVEIIIDGQHVHPTVIRWLLKLHSNICFVSDCVPVRGKISIQNGACRLPNGSLAGGGLLLPQAYDKWLRVESIATGISIQKLRKQTIDCVTSNPLKAIS